MRQPIFFVAALLAAHASAIADVVQWTTIRVLPTDAGKQPVVEILTNLESDEPLPEKLNLVMNRPPGFLGMHRPVLAGDMLVTAPHAHDFAADGPTLTWSHTPEAWVWQVQPPREARTLRLRYRVPTEGVRAAMENERGLEMVPTFGAAHSMLIAHTLIVAPENARPSRLFLSVFGPPDQRLISPWPLAADQRPGGPWYDAPVSVIERTEFIPFGDWKGPSFSARGLDISALFAPGCEDMQAALRDPLEKIADYAVRLFGTNTSDRFVMAFRAGVPGSGSTSATVGVNTIHFVLDPQQLGANPVPAIHTIAHEMIHLWGRNTLAIGSVSDMRWLHEGFTDYYATQVCTRLGLIPAQEIEDGIALRTENAKRTPARGHWSITDAGPKGMHGDRDSNDLVYQGGWLLACWLDAAIRTHAAETSRVSTLKRTGEDDPAKPNTLDEFMRDFYNDPRWSATDRPTPALFMQRLEKYLPKHRIQAFETWTREPWAFDAEKELAQVGVKFTSQEGPAQRMGVVMKPGTLEVERVAPASAAEALGVQPGDTITEINGKPTTEISHLRPAWLASGESETTIRVTRAGASLDLKGPKPRESKLVIDAAIVR